MTQIQMKGQTSVEHLPRLFRNRTVDYTLIVVGAIVAAFGAYTYFAPSSWVVAGLSAAWYLGSFIAGGVLLAAGLAMLGASLRDRSGHWNAPAITSFVLSALALAGAVTAAVVLIV
jgi:hypothetical protein